MPLSWSDRLGRLLDEGRRPIFQERESTMSQGIDERLSALGGTQPEDAVAERER